MHGRLSVHPGRRRWVGQHAPLSLRTRSQCACRRRRRKRPWCKSPLLACRAVRLGRVRHPMRGLLRARHKLLHTGRGLLARKRRSAIRVVGRLPGRLSRFHGDRRLGQRSRDRGRKPEQQQLFFGRTGQRRHARLSRVPPGCCASELGAPAAALQPPRRRQRHLPPIDRESHGRRPGQRQLQLHMSGSQSSVILSRRRS